MSLMLAATILVIAPNPDVATVDAAYLDVAAGRDAAAIDRLEASAEAHPAGIINLGVAHARRGETDAARKLFERAATMTERYELETATGSWIDSRALALKALASLDRGAFASEVRTARR